MDEKYIINDVRDYTQFKDKSFQVLKNHKLLMLS